MKKQLSLFIFFFIFCSLSAQTLISGLVKDESGQAITGVMVRQVDSPNYTLTDAYGAFHLVYDAAFAASFNFDKTHYLPLFIKYEEGLSMPMQIVMKYEPEEVIIPDFRLRRKKRGGVISANIDIINEDFDQFEPLLGKENVETLNRVAGIFYGELGFTRNRMYYGFPYRFYFHYQSRS